MITTAKDSIKHLAWITQGPQQKFYRWLLNKGSEYIVRDLEYNYEFKPMMKACYRNSTLGMLQHDMLYVEGFCLFHNVPIALDHAWNLNEVGDIVDTTAIEFNLVGKNYFGVIVPQKYVEMAMNSTYKTPLQFMYEQYLKNKTR